MKLALVTGGTRGIGAQISLDLKKNGFNVYASYQTNTQNAELFSSQNGIPIIQFDVKSFSECKSAIEKIMQENNKSIDILINNAGIVKDCMFHKMQQEDWHCVIDTNLNAIYNTCASTIEHMRKQKYGRIINISSINAFKGQLGQTNYAASKSALVGFSKALALESARCGITVNIISPGYIDTDMLKSMNEETLHSIIEKIPMQRLGKVHEISDAILFLIKQDYITGQSLHINGGLYM